MINPFFFCTKEINTKTEKKIVINKNKNPQRNNKIPFHFSFSFRFSYYSLFSMFSTQKLFLSQKNKKQIYFILFLLCSCHPHCDFVCNKNNKRTEKTIFSFDNNTCEYPMIRKVTNEIPNFLSSLLLLFFIAYYYMAIKYIKGGTMEPRGRQRYTHTAEIHLLAF